MLRIYFNADDVARTRLAPGFDPLWELVLSVHMLHRQPGDLLFHQWRRDALANVIDHIDRDRLRALLALCPVEGYFPDFLTPRAALDGLDHGIDAIRSTPHRVLRNEMRLLASRRQLPAQVAEIARGEVESLTQLTDTMRDYYDLVVGQHHRHLEQAVDQDRAMRIHAMVEGGTEGLLQSLSPMALWSDGELRIPNHRTQEIHLNGRGLLLIPSYFCLVRPLTMFDETRPPVLIYPVQRGQEIVASERAGGLDALIGRTRAAALHELSSGKSTQDLAVRIGVSSATASEHASVLRAAGLITSHRDKNRMIHQVTKLGVALLQRV